MYDFKAQMRNTLINSVARLTDRIVTIGKVTKSDEINNMVSVQYVDKNGKSRNKDNVPVRLYGNGGDWFPSVGDLVIIEESNDDMSVIARHVGNYNMDVRSKMLLKQDIYSDSGGGTSGGYIF
jgi:hypothetical protein